MVLCMTTKFTVVKVAKASHNEVHCHALKARPSEAL